MTLREARQLVFALLRRDPGYAGDAWERTMEIDKAIRADAAAKERERVVSILRKAQKLAYYVNIDSAIAAIERDEHNTEGEDAE